MTELRGSRELAARLKAIEKGGRTILGQWQIGTVYEAKKLVAVKTGNTRRTIRPGFLSGSSAFVEVGGAGLWLEKGTKPHTIRPRNKPFLAWPAPGVQTTLAGRASTPEVRRLGSGAFIFAAKVNHPGTRPQPFLEPGARRAAEQGGLSDVVIQLWNKGA